MIIWDISLLIRTLVLLGKGGETLRFPFSGYKKEVRLVTSVCFKLTVVCQSYLSPLCVASIQ